MSQINDITNIIQEFINTSPLVDWAIDLIPPEGIRNAIDPSYRNTVISNTSYLQEPGDEVVTSNSSFLDDTWGNNVRLKNQFKQEATNLLINTFIINRDKGKIVTNIREANQNARDLKEALFTELKNYLELDSDKLFDESGNYTDVMQNPDVKKAFLKLETWDADKITNNHNSKDYEMFKKYFIFKNFDSLLSLILGKAIIIKPGYNNVLTDEDTYSFSTKNDAVITSWRTTEDIQLDQEIGALAQSLINSTPYIQFGTDANTGNYIKFQDFYNIISKIKDAIYSPISSKIIYNNLDYPGFYKVFKNEQDRQTVYGNSLRQLISKIRSNPTLYTRLIFEGLANNESDLNRLGFTKDEKNKLWSIYKGIFATEGNSISAIQSKEDYRAQNYFNLITQVTDTISSVKFLQYNLTDNEINTILLKDYSIENIRKHIENVINWSNSKSIIAPLFKTTINKLNITPLQDVNNNLVGLQYFIKDTNGSNLLGIQFDAKNNNISFIDNNGKYLTNTQVNSFLDTSPDYFWKFIDDQLNLKISDDLAYQKAIKTYISEDTLPQLLKLSSSILFNNYVAIVQGVNFSGKNSIQNLYEQIYGKGNKYLPKYNTQTMEIGLVSTPYIPLLTRIARAKALSTGASDKIIIKDSEGKSLSQQTLSRLLGSLLQQVDWINSYSWGEKINPIKNFSFKQPGLFQGVYTTREFKSPYNSKKQTKFTVSEFIQGSFLYDFVGGLISTENDYSNNAFGNNSVGFISSINSDKETINRIKIDLNNQVQSKFAAINGKPFINLTQDELLQVISEQLGSYYNSQLHNIQTDFKKLEDWLYEVKGIHIEINIYDDFNQLNLLYDNPAKQLQEWTKEYNNTHNDNIALIDQTHYIANKDGSIKFNNTTRALQYRFNNLKALSLFMKAKEQELLKSMLDTNTEIILIDGNPSPIKQYIVDNYPKEWIKHGKMILAKIGDTDILSTQDLINLKLDPSKPHTWDNIIIHPLLAKYNSLDYLFTQEYLYCSVGSHTNHPVKVSYQTPIIFKNPKLGLSTYFKNHPEVRHYIMDFDDEFNELRNNWIANKLGIEYYVDKIDDEGYVYTDINPEFIKAKNKYLAEHSNDEDFQNLVRNSWERSKKRANQQNKILVCSQSVVLNMFPNDFSKALLLSDADSTLRGINSDWRANMLQKLGKSTTIKSFEVPTGTYFNNNLVTDYLLDEIKQLQDNEMLEESLRFAAQAKRNVALTATMHEFQLNQIDGIPSTYNMMILPDLISSVFTVSGDSSKGVNFDGATFVNPWVVIWENNSLNGAKAGINKKQFIHFYDRATGTGGIIKTAGFGLTNDKIRNDQFYRTMMYNMTKHNWKNEDGTQLIMSGKGILQDFEGNDLDFGDFYYKQGQHYYLGRIQEYSGNNTYKVFKQEVNQYGEPIKDGDIIDVRTDSNYDLWNMFGGMYSMSFLNGRLRGSEHSIELVARICNTYGIKKINGLAQTAEDVQQPLKHSDIHYAPTIGAVKQGPANINSNSVYFNREDVNFMKVEMRQAGIQLDKEHQADNEDLSLMTQVMSAACAMGYTKEDASRLYESLYNLTIENTKEFREGLGDLIQGDTDAFDAAITKIILEATINAKSSNGDMLQIMASNILKTIKNSKEFSINKNNFRDIDSQLPYSDVSISNKIVSTLASTLTKKGIKTRMPGVLAVLNPTQGIVKFYRVPVLDKNKDPMHNQDGSIKYKLARLSDIENDYDNAFEALQSLQDKEEFLPINYEGTVNSLPDIKIGRKYLVYYTDGTTNPDGTLIQKEHIFHVTMPHEFQTSPINVTYNNITYSENEIGYKQLLNYFSSNSPIKILGIKNFILGGQDLDSYDIHFKDSNGNSWQMCDMDIIQDYFKARELEDPRQFILQLLNKYNDKEAFIQEIVRDLQNSNIPNDIINTFTSSFDTNYVANYDSPQFEEYLKTYGLKFLNYELQKQLNSIRTDKESEDTSILVGGQQVNVDQNTIDVTDYGVIMPKVFKSAFGLEEYDQVQDILNNPDFFTDRLIKKLYTKVDNYLLDNGQRVYNYTLELKRINGNHIYIRRGLDYSDLTEEVPIFKEVDSDGKIWRIDSDNNRMYQLFSDNDKVYKDYSGNEIIVTSTNDVFRDSEGNVLNIHKQNGQLIDNLGNEYISTPQGLYINSKTGDQIFKESPIQFYLDTMKYNFVNINSYCTNDEIGDIHKACFNSTNKKANSFYRRLNSIMDKAKTEKDGWTNIRKFLKAQTTFKDNVFRELLKREGTEIWNSFKKSLHIVAARIPSQNQASFMAMTVPAFENTDTNNAFVSIFQFFLQGSDLDIDAASLQTFDFDRNGLFEGHSPYYNLTDQRLMKASENLPFPTGIKLTSEEVSNYTESTMHELLHEQGINHKKLFGYQGQENSKDALFLINIRNDKSVELTVNTNSIENIKLLTDILNQYKDSTWKVYNGEGTTDILALQSLLSQEEHNVPLTSSIYEDIDNKIMNALNQHYAYLDNKSKSEKDKIIKNYAITALYNIIRNPVNLREAMSSVDISTQKAKGLAAKSSKVQNSATPGNVFNKVQLIAENMTGKDGIGITATGLKSFFAATNMINTVMNQNPKEASKLIHGISIGGKTYYGIANINVENIEDVINNTVVSRRKEIEDYLKSQPWELDASNELSAFLSLSVDNAKDLALSKLNAGDSTLGMYIYGLSIGVPVETLVKIINSPLGIRLAELTKGDIFNNNPGTGSILNTISYLHNDPNDLLSKYNDIDLSSYSGVKKPWEYLKDELINNSKGIFKQLDPDSSNILYQLASKEHIEYYLEQYFRNRVNTLKSQITDDRVFTIYKALYDQALDFVEQYIRDVQLWKFGGEYATIYGKESFASSIEKLAYGADEFKKLGQILRLNQEIKTNTDDLYTQVSRIQELITKRIRQISSANLRHSNYAEQMGIVLDSEDSKTPDIWTFDLHKFLTNIQYREKYINKYDQLKQTINPLRVITTNPQYLGYVQSLDIVHTGLLHKQMKYKITVNRGSDFIKRQKVTASKLKQQVFKNVNSFVDYYLRQSWMQSEKLSFLIPGSTDLKTTYIFQNNINTPIKLLFDKSIQLGTDIGDANFKLWMEQTVIPQLKNDVKLRNNKFIQELSPVLQTNTNIGLPSISYGLSGVNMLPQTDVEREEFDVYKDAFNQLSKYPVLKNNNKSWKIQDLFYLYSLISTNGKLGPTSLHKIFEDYQNSDIINSYKLYSASKENNPIFFRQLNLALTDEWMAPFSSPFRGGSKFFKYKDNNTHQVYFYRLEEKDNEQEPGYEFDDEPGYEIDDEYNEDTMAFVNGYNREFSDALSSRDSRYFSNPVVINSDTNLHYISSSDEVLKNYVISYEIKKGKPILNSISYSGKELDITKEFINLYKKTKGKLPTKIQEINGKFEQVLDEDAISNQLYNLEHKCE